MNNIQYKLKSAIYDSTLGYFYTKSIVAMVLLSFPNNSTILDVGIGTGYTYTQNRDIIIQKNLKIVGVDIDPEYVDTAQKAIESSQLQSYITVKCINIYYLTIDDKFDFVYFSGSYAVIPDIKPMMNWCEKFLTVTGKMVISTALFDKYSANLNKLKENIGRISSVEMGQMMMREDLEQYIVEKHPVDYKFMVIDERWIVFFGTVKTYLVTWSPQPQNNV